MFRQLRTRRFARHDRREVVSPDGQPVADVESVERRRVLRLGGMAAAGAAGAAIAAAASASPAGANDGDPLTLGTNGAPNNSTQPTGLYYNNGSAYQQGFFGLGVIDHSTTNGVFDHEPAVGGVANFINFGAGVQGIGTNGAAGVVGTSDNGNGVEARSTDAFGVFASSTNSDGLFAEGKLFGVVGSPTASGGTGVFGAGLGNNSTGVTGQSDVGFAILGTATDVGGVGVLGAQGGDGVGDALVAFHAGSGRAIYATDTDPTDLDLGSPGTCTGIEVALQNASNGSDVIKASTVGSGAGLRVSSQAGAAVAALSNSGPGFQATSVSGPALNAQAINGSALIATAGILNTNSTADATHISHVGKGRGLNVDLSNTANAADGITVTHEGTGIAVKAQSNGKGAAIVAANTTNATSPTIDATSASTQPAVRATGKAVSGGNGAALAVQGVASFTRSGLANIGSGAGSVNVPVPGGLTATSHALATLQGNVSGTVAVKSVVVNTTTGQLTIYLTGNAPAALTVAWFVFG